MALTPKKTALAVGLAVVLAAGAVTAAVWWSDDPAVCGEDDDWTGHFEQNSSDSGQVELVEQGIVPVQRDGFDLLSYGFVVKNRSRDIATNIHLEYNITDDTGSPAFDRARSLKIMVPILLPGEEAGMGDYLVPTTESPDTVLDLDYSSLKLKLTGYQATSWTAAEDVVLDQLTPEVTDLVLPDAEMFEPAEDAGDADYVVMSEDPQSISYAIESSYCGPFWSYGRSAVLFRDHNGDIIGGMPSAVGPLAKYSPGRTEIEQDVAMLPDGITPERTIVHPYPIPETFPVRIYN